MRYLFTISQGCLIDWRHFYYIPTHKYITLAIIISNFFVSCLAIFQIIENKRGHGQKYIITSSPELNVLFTHWARPSSYFIVERLAGNVSVT